MIEGRTMNQTEAEQKIMDIWRGIGFSRMLTTIANVIESDTNKLPLSSKYKRERQMKLALVKSLHEAANWMEE